MIDVFPANPGAGYPANHEEVQHDTYEDVELTPASFHVLKTSSDIAGMLLEKLMEVRELLEKLKTTHRDILGYKVLPKTEPLPGIAVDSTFPIDGGLELIGGRLVAVIAGYICFLGVKTRDMPCKDVFAKAWLIESEEQHKQIPLVAKSLEKALTLRLLNSIKEEKADARILLLDGEIIPYQLLFRHEKSIHANKLLSRLDRQCCSMLREAAKANVAIVGVVKRSYSKLLSVKLNRLLPLNDKAILSLVLEQGHYTVLGDFNELLPRYASLIAPYNKGDKFRKIVEQRLLSCPEYGEITIAYYKPSRPSRGAYAVRVEIFTPKNFDKNIDEILGILNSLTNPATGLPYPIDLVDEYTRMESRILELLRRRIIHVISTMSKNLPAGSLKLLAHTNPEKKYIYEPHRSRG